MYAFHCLIGVWDAGMGSLPASIAQSTEEEVLDFHTYGTDGKQTSWLSQSSRQIALVCLQTFSASTQAKGSSDLYVRSTCYLYKGSSIIDRASKNVVLEILATTTALVSNRQRSLCLLGNEM